MENNDAKDLIIGELIKILKPLYPNDIDLLSILGSYNDTLEDWEVYQLLYSWRTTGSSFESISCRLDGDC